MNQKAVMVAAGIGVGLLALVLVRRMTASSGGSVAQGLGQALVETVTDTAAGVVVGVGEVVGIPQTDKSKGLAAIDRFEAAKAAGDYWEQARAAFDVSFYLPASDYLKWAATGARPAL
jgi:hypothetical protein